MVSPKANILFEVSWEVCNKVGGIYTVVKSKAELINNAYEEYYLIGPYIDKDARESFNEKAPPEMFAKIFNELSVQGIKCRYGEWLIKGKNPGDVWQINTQPSSEKHYAMWPEKLVERMLLCSTKENDIILDPFAGSGTTLKVAVQNRRKAVGIDLGYSDIQERKLKDIQIKML